MMWMSIRFRFCREQDSVATKIIRVAKPLTVELSVMIEFDRDKDAFNVRKHGLSLSVAADMDLSAALVRQDERYAYVEVRFQALGMIDERLHMLVFTMRGSVLRAISLRKANSREERDYDQKD